MIVPDLPGGIDKGSFGKDDEAFVSSTLEDLEDPEVTDETEPRLKGNLQDPQLGNDFAASFALLDASSLAALAAALAPSGPVKLLPDFLNEDESELSAVERVTTGDSSS